MQHFVSFNFVFQAEHVVGACLDQTILATSLFACVHGYSGLICNCFPNMLFEGEDDEEDDGSNCK
jgi:hypothetical protein